MECVVKLTLVLHLILPDLSNQITHNYNIFKGLTSAKRNMLNNIISYVSQQEECGNR